MEGIIWWARTAMQELRAPRPSLGPHADSLWMKFEGSYGHLMFAVYQVIKSQKYISVLLAYVQQKQDVHPWIKQTEGENMEYMMPRVTSNVGVCSQRYHWIEKQVHDISELHQVAKKKNTTKQITMLPLPNPRAPKPQAIKCILKYIQPSFSFPRYL